MEFGGVKAGGLSLTSETSMLRMTVEDMAGEPLSKACTDREYRDTCRERSTNRMYQAFGHVITVDSINGDLERVWRFLQPVKQKIAMDCCRDTVLKGASLRAPCPAAC